MKCLVCDKEFNEKRFLSDLFRTKKYYVCLNCLKNNPIDIQFNIVPLDNHMLEIVSLFPKDRHINYDGYIDEYSKVYQKLLETKKNEQVIMCDSFILNEKNLTEYNYISRALDKDIVILTNVLK